MLNRSFWTAATALTVLSQLAPPAAHSNGSNRYIATSIVPRGGATTTSVEPGLFLIDPASGDRVVRLESGYLRQPHWSPDRKRLVFARGYDEKVELWVVDLQQNRDRITNNDLADRWPSWAPDSSRLVVEGSDLSSGSFDAELFVVRADGSGERAITANDVDDLCPDWSPDGSRIAFWRSESPQIYTIRPDGTGLRAITSGPGRDHGPIWSPDGRKVLFQRYRPGADQDDLFVVDKDGTHLQRLTDTPRAELEYGWSPDGTKIVFVGSSRTKRNFLSLWVMSGDGSRERRLTSGANETREPSWSPDGSRIVYRPFSGDGIGDLWIVRVDGSRNRRLTDTSALFEVDPAWGRPVQECLGAF